MSESSRTRVLLIDGHSMAFRAYFALPVDNFATSSGEPTNAVFGFTSMLINVLKSEEPTHVAIAFDAGRTTFRTERYPDYKGTRDETPVPFRGQVPLIKDVLDALNITWLERPGFEADDILATLATLGVRDDCDVLVCSGDRDTFQLVTDDVTVLYPIKGVSELARMTPDAILAKYGVLPGHYPDIAALVGETSDNLPGVPGVGPKTAAKWVNEFGDTDGVLAAAGSIKGKAGESLRANAEQVRLNRQLNALVRNVDLGVQLSDLVRGRYDRPRVDEIFDVLQFRTLRDRLYQAFPQESELIADAPTVDGHLADGGDVDVWLADHVDDRIALDIRGQVRQGRGDAWMVSLAAPDGTALSIDLNELDPADDVVLAAWLADPSQRKSIHDLKFAMHVLGDRGYTVEGVEIDTLLGAYLCHPDQRVYDVADLSVRYLGREMESPHPSTQAELDLDGGSEAESSWTRAATIGEVADVVEVSLTERDALPPLRGIEIPLARVLASMERAGVAADADYLRELERDFATRAEGVAQEAYDIIGHPVNLGSPKQLQEVLFDELEMPKTKKIKTGYTTDAESLAELFAKTEHPFLARLLAHRDLTKLRQSVDGLLRSIADDGRIHTTYQQTIAATGRLSSVDPNLQNIPTRTEEGRRIRAAFVVGDGYETLLTADYSQIEMRIMAHLSGDEALIEAFKSGEDLHSYIGARVFGVAPEDVTSIMRSKVKAMSYGLAYGLSAFGLSRQLGIDTADARILIEDYLTRFGGVRDYLATVVDEARKLGYTETIRGRRRYLPDLTSDHRQRREIAERVALNSPIQGSAADVVKEAMIRFDRSVRAAGLRSRLLLQVHDELVVEVAQGEVDDVEALLRDAMTGAESLSVPLDVSVGRGLNWRDAAH